MHDTPSTADIASSNAHDAQKRLEIVEKRLEALYQATFGQGGMTRAEFEQAWAAAIPKPVVHAPVDYSKMPGYWPTRLLGDAEE